MSLKEKVNNFLNRKNKDHTKIYSLGNFLYDFDISEEEFLKISSSDKLMIRNKIETNILHSLKIRNPKDLIFILYEKFETVNVIKDNLITIVVPSEYIHK